MSVVTAAAENRRVGRVRVQGRRATKIYTRTPPAAHPERDPHVELWAWLRTWAGANPHKGNRRAWAALRAEGMVINRKKVQRLWREEDLRVAVRKVRKRNGTTTTPITQADAPNVVWAVDFQFDSTRDGRMFKIASMVDEHTRASLMDITERSITGPDLIAAVDRVVTARGLPMVIRAGNSPELVCQVLKEYCEDRIGVHYIAPGQPMAERLHGIVLQPLPRRNA